MSASDNRTLRVLNLEQGIGEPIAALRERALRAAGVAPEEVLGFRIAKRSIDGRRRGGSRALRFVVQAELVVASEVPEQWQFDVGQ